MLLGVFVQDAVYRNFALLMGLLVILLVQVMTWPYKSSFHNWFALFVTWMLLVITCVTQPNLYLIMDPGRYTSWTLTAFVILIGAFLVTLETVLRRHYGLTVEIFFNKCLVRVLKKPFGAPGAEASEKVNEAPVETGVQGYKHLREPLLDANDIGHSEGNILFSRSSETLSSSRKVSSSHRGDSSLAQSGLVHTTVVSLADGINSD